jgi:hypothetical protein
MMTGAIFNLILIILAIIFYNQKEITVDQNIQELEEQKSLN